MLKRYKPPSTKKTTRVKKAEINVWSFADPIDRGVFDAIRRHTGHSKLVSLIQGLGRRGYTKENALDLLDKKGARAVELALNFRNIELNNFTSIIRNAIKSLGYPEVKKILNLAKNKKVNPVQLLTKAQAEYAQKKN